MAIERWNKASLGSRGGPYLLAAHLIGLVAIYAGERLVGGYGTTRWITSGVGGALAISSCAGWFAIGSRFKGTQNAVLSLSAWLSLGGVFALILYLIGSDIVMGPGPVTRSGKEGIDFRQLTAAAWPIALICAELPLIFVQWSAGFSAGARAAQRLKTEASARSGATIAALACTLFMINAIANRKDAHVDLSYLKSAEPSESSKELVMGMGEDTEAMLFFPSTSEVLQRVQSYFEGLKGLSAHFRVSVVDPALAPDLVRKHQIASYAAIVLVRKENSQKIVLDIDLEKAKRMLDKLDAEFQKAVLKLTSGRKTIYFVTGHQERTTQAARTDSRPQMEILREFIEKNNFRTKDLSAAEGLSHEVPSDASLLIWMDPASGLFPGELESIERYLSGGGRMLLALDPDSVPDLGGLMGFLGLSYLRAPLANDKSYIPLRRTSADKYNLVTNSFSAHPQVDTLSRANKRILVLFPKTGSLTKASKTDKKITFTVNSPMDSWPDENGNMMKDPKERPKTYSLAAAITAEAQAKEAKAGSPEAGAGKTGGQNKAGAHSDEMRVAVFGDTDLFSNDYIGFRVGLYGHPGNYQLLADTLKWLLGEGQVSGVSTTEEDIKIVHTRDEDVFWFYATVFAVPLVILSLGVITGWGRGRKRRQGQ